MSFDISVVVVVLFCTMLLLSKGYTQENTISAKPGRYVPEIHGGQRGRYIPDDSGKYRHMHIPYDGGYGDRGVTYENDLRGIFRAPLEDYQRGVQAIVAPKPAAFALGPNDHLRFMIDFNYNGTGWQIIQFKWLRDGDEKRQYNYMHENQLWSDAKDTSKAYEYEQPKQQEDEVEEQQYANVAGDTAAAAAAEDEAAQQPADESQVHVEGSYDQEEQSYHVNYSRDQQQSDVERARQKDPNIQAAIHEVLEYIQKHILPTL